MIKFKRSRWIGIIATSLYALAQLSVAPVSHAAGSATLSLSPAGGTYNIGNVFAVTITENSGAEAINAVEASIAYDPAYLQYESHTTNNAVFDLAAPASTGGGVITIPVAKSGSPITGSQTVATVRFKVLAAISSTPLAFRFNSAIVRASDVTNIWNGSPTGASYTLANPNQPGGGGTTTTTGTGTKKTTTTAEKNSATTVTSTATDQTKKIETTPTAAVPKTYNVAITVLDSKGKPVKDATVTLRSDPMTTTTNDAGVAEFKGVTAGQHTVEIVSGKNKLSKTITVIASDQVVSLQEFSFIMGPSRTAQVLWLVGIIMIILILLGGGIGLAKSLIHHKPNLTLPDVSQPQAITTTGSPATPPVEQPKPVSVPVNTANASSKPGLFYPDPQVKRITKSSIASPEGEKE